MSIIFFIIKHSTFAQKFSWTTIASHLSNVIDKNGCIESYHNPVNDPKYFKIASIVRTFDSFASVYKNK
jgi:hypothetical protein